MADTMLGKVVASAALGGASLLVFAPGMAYAGGHHGEGEGRLYAEPHEARAGDEVKLVEICSEPYEPAQVWSTVTGTVKLHEVREDHGAEHGWQDRDEEDADQGPDGKDRPGRADEGRGEEGRGDEQGRDEHPQPPADGPTGYPLPPANGPTGYPLPPANGPTGYPLPPANGPYPLPPADVRGDGTADDSSDEGHDWNGHEEDGQDEDGWEHKRDFVYHGEAHVSDEAQPGTYPLHGSCGHGELTVMPTGPVDGGDGGMTTTSTDRGMAAGGAGMMGAAALGGLVLLRRRRADDLG